MREIFSGDETLVQFIQRSLGYALTGDTSEQAFWILWGTGANGKSTMLRAVFTLLRGYAAHTRAETIMVKRSDTIPADVAALHRARWVYASETARGQQLNEEMVKAATGDEPLTARFLHKDFFTFVPQFKLWVAVNHKPRIKGTDLAIWRRPKLVPFTRSFRGADADKGLGGKLLAELPGILAWCVAGERDRQRDGLRPPASVIAATREYRVEEDRLAPWLRDKCVPDPAAAPTPFRTLFESYLQWAERAREFKPLSQKSFAEALTERGWEAGHSGVERVRKGVRLQRFLVDTPEAVRLAWVTWEAARDGYPVGRTPVVVAEPVRTC